MLPRIYIVRHGQTDWNVEGRLQGQADTDINALGRRQADRNGRKLAALIDDPEKFDFVASPLIRTRDTMQRLRSAMGLPPAGYRTDRRLVEVHFGDWQGSTYAEIEMRHPGATGARSADKWDFVPPGRDGESYALLARRVRAWLDGVERPTVCVTHGGVVRCVFYLLGRLSGTEAAALDIPQDRILQVEGDRLEWL